MLNNKTFTNTLLHYKTGDPIMVDQGPGLAEVAGSPAGTFAVSASTWQPVYEFDPTGWARLGVEGISSTVVSLRVTFGYKNAAGTFVPLSKSSTITLLTASAIGDALSCEVVGPWARLEVLSETGTATVDFLVQGRMVS